MRGCDVRHVAKSDLELSYDRAETFAVLFKVSSAINHGGRKMPTVHRAAKVKLCFASMKGAVFTDVAQALSNRALT